MAWTISDHDSAAGNLDQVRDLVGRLDLDHPDPLYQAGKADQLARAAADLAHNLRVIATGRRLHRHLVDDHGRAELAATPRTPTCGPATTATTTTPACPPADPTPTKTTSP